MMANGAILTALFDELRAKLAKSEAGNQELRLHIGRLNEEGERSEQIRGELADELNALESANVTLREENQELEEAEELIAQSLSIYRDRIVVESLNANDDLGGRWKLELDFFDKAFGKAEPVAEALAGEAPKGTGAISPTAIGQIGEAVADGEKGASRHTPCSDPWHEEK